MLIRNHLIKAALLIVPLFQLVASSPSPANLNRSVTKMHVMIDGIDFGTFDRPDNLTQRPSTRTKSSRITLQRDFVTDKSLYQWTSNASQIHMGPRNIALVMKDQYGRDTETITLKYCQAVSWSVEAANPSMGGYHERVDFAIQGIERPAVIY